MGVQWVQIIAVPLNSKQNPAQQILLFFPVLYYKVQPSLLKKKNIKWQRSQCSGVSTSTIPFTIGYLLSSFLQQISFYQQNSEMEDLLIECADERCSRHCRKLPFSCPTSSFEPRRYPQHSICMPWFCSLSRWTLWGARTASITHCIMENECDKEIK